MTFSSTKFRLNTVLGSPVKKIPCGTVLDTTNVYDIVFLQDYKSTFTGQMPPSTGPWVGVPQIMDRVASCVATAYTRARFGLAHFSDFGTSPYGVPGEDFTYQEIIPLTDVSSLNPLLWNTAAYTSAQHGGFASVNGGDTLNGAVQAAYECVTSGTMGWSSISVLDSQNSDAAVNYNRRFVIVFTDQLPHTQTYEAGVPHVTLSTLSNALSLKFQMIYVLINDDYAGIKNFEPNFPQSLLGYCYPLTFRKSDLFIGAPDYTINDFAVSEKVLATLYNASIGYI